MMFFIIVLGVLTGIYTMVGRVAGGGLDREHPNRVLLIGACASRRSAIM